ncbi:MAG: hypothetical protein ABJN43_06170, partial [Sneathiella sp.]
MMSDKREKKTIESYAGSGGLNKINTIILTNIFDNKGKDFQDRKVIISLLNQAGIKIEGIMNRAIGQITTAYRALKNRAYKAEHKPTSKGSSKVPKDYIPSADQLDQQFDAFIDSVIKILADS